MSKNNLKLTSTREQFTIEDPSGYKFTIISEYDPEWGWSACVSMTSSGYKTSEAAIAFLKNPASHFLRMLKESIKDED